ncbi:hypothetical protein E7T06_20970 [Deinococcus sp. Arct2-2]|uniref:hypothetical protein n=1 Tax=Deinococcus sp. Arct2-2 TaxID=2568653 RepID=UPI0010A2D08B|nr:hypothetical protein [Deinococcus sp. Arct2-2]THF66027.1 hypothetical protein E7T06_20970 [Deinococcus sp. Arct2-2]
MKSPDRFGLRGHPGIQAARKTQLGGGPFLLIAFSVLAAINVLTWSSEYGLNAFNLFLIACSTVPVFVGWWLWNRARRNGQSSQATVSAAASILIVGFVVRCLLDWRTQQPLGVVDWVVVTALIVLLPMAALLYRRR